MKKALPILLVVLGMTQIVGEATRFNPLIGIAAAWGALTCAPVIPPELREPVLRSALGGDAPLRRELGIERGAGETVVVIEPRVGASMHGLRTRFVAPCR